MKWIALVITLPIMGMNNEYDNIHKMISTNKLSDSQDEIERIHRFISQEIENAEREQKSIVTRYRVKGATLSLALSGIAIYNAASSLFDIATDDSDETDYSAPIISLINSGFLFWYSGKEIYKVARNHHAKRKAEKALLLKFMLKEHEDSTRSAPAQSSSSYSLGENNG